MTFPSSLKPLTLHAHDSGPNPFKVAIALELLHIPYTVKLWEFGDGHSGVKGSRFLAISENGRLPALEDANTGVVAWESGAVLNYILRVYDSTDSLGPSHGGTVQASEQGKVDFDKWIFFLVSGLGPMTGQVNWFRHYHEGGNQDALKRYEAQTYRTYDVLEGQLERSGGLSVLKGGFGAVDVHFYPWVFEWDFAGLSLERYPGIKKWLGVIGGMEAVKKAYEKVPKGEKA